MSTPATDWIDQHFRAHGIKYLWTLLLAVGFGSWATGILAQWLDGRMVPIVVTQVAAQLAPVQKQVEDLDQKIDATAKGVEQLLKQSTTREIVEIQTLLCVTPGDSRLLRSLEAAQERYAELSGGARYVPPDCRILTRRAP